MQRFEQGSNQIYSGAKERDGSSELDCDKSSASSDTMGYLLELHVTPAGTQDRGEVERPARILQAVTDDTVEIAYIDQCYTGAGTADAAAIRGIKLEVIKLPEAKQAVVRLPRRLAIIRKGNRLRRLVEDYERYALTLAAPHVVASLESR
ncbi:MAG: hypothetical protein DI555_23685 [Novosphingobium pentaromativorans]|uniref:Transposase IS4-like domain-containing protein n=1 Tax=Novosphingobium pentaromativorans TaxID=205844 RepID=A0A2W5N7W9_9SPHN|nr:MAG: hypothetical protein DI555_23685 [Novosphingobium pentaromativorans]